MVAMGQNLEPGDRRCLVIVSINHPMYLGVPNWTQNTHLLHQVICVYMHMYIYICDMYIYIFIICIYIFMCIESSLLHGSERY